MKANHAPYSQYVELSFEDGPCCPACRSGFASGDNLVVCPACRALAHQECLGKVGTCTTFGCSYGVPVPPLPRSRPRRRLAVLGSALLLAVGGALLWSAQPEPPIGCELPKVVPIYCEVPVVIPVADTPIPQIALPRLERPQLELRVPTRVRSNEVLISGQIVGDGPLRVEVSAPSGRVAWDAFEPGPFVTGVTLLSTGRHEIRVTVTDHSGRVTTSSYLVYRAS
jgi:hypothetical protein